MTEAQDMANTAYMQNRQDMALQTLSLTAHTELLKLTADSLAKLVKIQMATLTPKQIKELGL